MALWAWGLCLPEPHPNMQVISELPSGRKVPDSSLVTTPAPAFCACAALPSDAELLGPRDVSALLLLPCVPCTGPLPSPLAPVASNRSERGAEEEGKKGKAWHLSHRNTFIFTKNIDKEKQSLHNIFYACRLVFFLSPDFSPQAQSEAG